VKVPTLAEQETAKYQLTDKETRRPKGHMTQVLRRVSEGEENCYEVNVVTETGTGDVVEEVLLLQGAESLSPRAYRMAGKRRDGSTAIEGQIVYDQSDLPPNGLPVAGIGVWLRGAPFGGKKTGLTFHLVGHQGARLRMEGTVFPKKEKVSVKAGEFQCYKIDVTPDVVSLMDLQGSSVPIPGLSTFMRQFTTTFHYWYAIEKPHQLVKFEAYLFDPFQGSEAVGELM